VGLYEAFRPLLFKLPSETAHSLGKGAMRVAQSSDLVRGAVRSQYSYRHPKLRVEEFGTTFPTPVGVAAGFDKNAEVCHCLSDLGFGFVEVGTVTPEPQEGNPRPRLFRLREDGAMINRLGFNSQGANRVRERLESEGLPDIPVGINIGKMNDSGESEAIAEAACEAGAEVPALRPDRLADPHVQLPEVVENHLDIVAASDAYEPDVIAVLPYVTPLRTAAHVDEAIDTMSIFSVDSVISVYESNEFLWRPGKYGLEPLFEERLLRRERETTYYENGAIYVTTPDTVSHHSDLIGQHVGHIQMCKLNSIHIDSWYDFEICKHFFKSRESVGFASPDLQQL